MHLVYPIGARTRLVGPAIAQHTLKFGQIRRIKDCQTPVPELGKTLAHLKQPLHFGGRETFTACRLERVGDVKPFLSAADNVEPGRNSIDLARNVRQAVPDRNLPMPLHFRQSLCKKTQYAALALKRQIALACGTVESALPQLLEADSFKREISGPGLRTHPVD